MPDTPPPGRTRTLACPNCGGSVTIRANGLSISAICQSCGATIDLASPDLTLIGDAQARTKQPLIAIGTRATLVGTLWEVVGYQTRSDIVEGFTWDEYLLFSPYHGFRFLVSDEENWTLYAMLPQDVPDPAAGVGDNRRYDHMSESRARTDYVMGEFYWRVRVGDEAAVTEYAASPYLLSREANGEEITWSRGRQLPAAEVTQAFKLAAGAVPETLFDAAILRKRDNRAVRRITLAALILLALLAIIPFGRFHNAILLQQDVQATVQDRGHPVVTPDFTVPAASGNLAIDIATPVTNAWAEFSLALVETSTNKTLNADITVAEYQGVDEDGTWTEGARSERALFAQVPGGQYHLLIDTDAQAFHTATADPVRYTVTIRRHVTISVLFWLCFWALLVYPIWRFLIRRFFAKPAEGTRA